MDKEAAVERLREILHDPQGEPDSDHQEADEILLALIDDADVREAYKAIPKWYA